MNAGDFFWGDPVDVGIEHPWVLLNTPLPMGKVVLVNFTDLESRDLPYYDETFHKSLYKKSVPSLGDMLVWQEIELTNAITTGVMKPRPPPVLPEKMHRLLNSARLAGFVSREVKKLIS